MEHGLVIHRVMKEISCDCSFPTFSKMNYYDWALQHHVHVNHPVVVVGFGQFAKLLPPPISFLIRWITIPRSIMRLLLPNALTSLPQHSDVSSPLLGTYGVPRR